MPDTSFWRFSSLVLCYWTSVGMVSFLFPWKLKEYQQRVMIRISLTKYVFTHGCVCVRCFLVQYLPFLSALRKICNEKRKKEGCQKRFHIIKVETSVCVCVDHRSHTQRQCVVKLLIVLSQSPEEMKGRVAMTTSALKGSNHLEIALPTFSSRLVCTCEEESEQPSSLFTHYHYRLNLTASLWMCKIWILKCHPSVFGFS